VYMEPPLKLRHLNFLTLWWISSVHGARTREGNAKLFTGTKLRPLISLPVADFLCTWSQDVGRKRWTLHKYKTTAASDFLTCDGFPLYMEPQVKLRPLISLHVSDFLCTWS
jgi:hypothetical protein